MNKVKNENWGQFGETLKKEELKKIQGGNVNGPELVGCVKKLCPAEILTECQTRKISFLAMSP